MFGVPLTLLTIADVGKFFSEHLIWLYGCYLNLKLKIKRKLRRMRKLPTDDRVCHKCRNHDHKNHHGSISGGPGVHVGHGPSGSFSDRRGSMMRHDYFDALDYHEETVPATLLLVILVGYTALGGLLLQNVEAWSFFESFYFSFITMTTIGFGVSTVEARMLFDYCSPVGGVADAAYIDYSLFYYFSDSITSMSL